MTTPFAAPVRGLALAVLLTGCIGPYTNVGEQLDVTQPLQGARTFVASGEAGATRLLVMSPASATAAARFAFVTSANWREVRTLTGTWSTDAVTRATTFRGDTRYTLPDEAGKGVLSRSGAQRAAVDELLTVTIQPDGETLDVTGDPSLAGRWLSLETAMARLGSATADDASCAFQVANLSMQSIRARIFGFNGPGMFQYTKAATFSGLLGGSVTVKMSGLFNPRTDFTFASISDLSGVTVDGPQSTETNTSGDGYMFGTIRFTLQPSAPYAAIRGSADYGSADGSGDSVRLSGGDPLGGHYAVTLEGGATTRVAANLDEGGFTPSVAACLQLP